MGQATLAFRNLLVRVAIFVVLAAILAWFFNGTIFGKHTVNFPAITWDGREWAAQVIGNGTRPDEVRWSLLSKLGEEPWTVVPISKTGQWRKLVGPNVDDQGLWIKVAENVSTDAPELKWTLIRFTQSGSEPSKMPVASMPLPSAQ